MHKLGYLESVLDQLLPGNQSCPICDKKVSTLFAKSNKNLEITYVCYGCYKHQLDISVVDRDKMTNQHGGSRSPVRKDDGRLLREIAEPTRATITLEKSHLKQLKAKHGRNWQKVVRSLVAAHLSYDKP